MAITLQSSPLHPYQTDSRQMPLSGNSSPESYFLRRSLFDKIEISYGHIRPLYRSAYFRTMKVVQMVVWKGRLCSKEIFS